MLLDLTKPNNQHLLEAGFNIAEIEQSPTLVKLLNQFNGTLIIDHDKSHKIIGANASGNVIQIESGMKNLLAIAHELGHATGRYQQINSDKNNLYHFDNPKEYSIARARAEGEATYYEFLVAKELGVTTFKKPLWLDNEATPKDQDVYVLVNQIIESPISEADKIEALAQLNQAMLSSGQLHHPLYTYDEYNNLVFLNNRYSESKIANDFEQAIGKPFDWNTFETKSLANKANGYYGTLGDDVIINAKAGGSVLGQQGQGDLLWGSAGNDVMVGNTGKDILLGGADNDVLIGGAGTDTLAGGKGNDLYYMTAGFGQDTIVNNGGGMDNVYLADIGYNELALVSQENKDLTLSFSSNHSANATSQNDQLTVKNFFLGGDNASLNVNFGKGGGVLTGEQLLANQTSNENARQIISTTTNTADYDMALAQMLQLLNDKNKGQLP